jgi:predicted AAA+ superfamily ATPase
MGIKQYLLDKKKEIKELEVKEREGEIEKTKSFATTVIGPRRAGKSFFLYYITKKEGLEDSSYTFINFEDDEVKTAKRDEKVKLIEYHLEEYKREPTFIFLDEIQSLEGWESFLYSLIEKKRYSIFVTGSNSRFLSKEVATQLRGRALTKVILPFSFREYLKLKDFSLPKHSSSYDISKVKGYLRDYLLFSGFPSLLLENIKPKQFFSDYLDVVIFKDLVERYNIENLFVMRFLMRKAISQFAKEFSINKVYNELKAENIKVGKGILYSYFSYLEDVMFSFLLRKFSFSERQSLLSLPKIYLCDQGFPNFSLSTKTSEDFGRVMENSVFLELKKKELENKNLSLFYFKSNNEEVDFVVKDGFDVKQLIQVTFTSNKDEVEDREIKSLVKASNLLKCNNLLVISWDYEDEITVDKKRIKFIPLWEWLLKGY